MDLLVDSSQFDIGIQKLITESESPFKWMPVQERKTKFSYVDSDYLINKCNNIEGKTGFNVYVKLMCLIYELEHMDRDNVMDKLEEWKVHFENSKDDKLINKVKPALQHILLSSEAYLLLKRGEYSKAKQVVQILNSATFTDRHNKAAVCGLKAKFFQRYGSKGHKEALSFAEEALELDENEPEWIAVTAKNLKDVRRSELHNNDESALESLNREYSLYKKLTELSAAKPAFFLRFGNTLFDLARYKNWNKRQYSYVKNIYQEINEYCKEGMRYFFKAEECETPTSIKTYLRLISGVTSMPRYHGKKYIFHVNRWVGILSKLIEEEKISDHDHNGEIAFTVGKYYKDLKMNNQEAEKQFEKAAQLGFFNAKRELIIMKFKSDPTYDPCHDIEDPVRTVRSLCQIASFYLFNKRDCVKAVETFKRLLEIDPTVNSPFILSHKSWFIHMKEPINLLEVLINEVLTNKEHTGDIILSQFISSMHNDAPNVLAKVQSNLNPNEIEKLLLASNTKEKYPRNDRPSQVYKAKQNCNWRERRNFN